MKRFVDVLNKWKQKYNIYHVNNLKSNVHFTNFM